MKKHFHKNVIYYKKAALKSFVNTNSGNYLPEGLSKEQQDRSIVGIKQQKEASEGTNVCEKYCSAKKKTKFFTIGRAVRQ